MQFYKVKASSENLNVVRNKNENNIPLTDNEAIDLLMAPDMTHDYNIRELLEMTSKLLRDAKILDREFHCDLIDCQKKVMQRFLKKRRKKGDGKYVKLESDRLWAGTKRHRIRRSSDLKTIKKLRNE